MPSTDNIHSDQNVYVLKLSVPLQSDDGRAMQFDLPRLLLLPFRTYRQPAGSDYDGVIRLPQFDRPINARRSLETYRFQARRTNHPGYDHRVRGPRVPKRLKLRRMHLELVVVGIPIWRNRPHHYRTHDPCRILQWECQRGRLFTSHGSQVSNPRPPRSSCCGHRGTRDEILWRMRARGCTHESSFRTVCADRSVRRIARLAPYSWTFQPHSGSHLPKGG